MQKSLGRIFSVFLKVSVNFFRCARRHVPGCGVEYHTLLNIFFRLGRIRLDISSWSVWQIRACHAPGLIRQ